jgi:hypothetical protein
MLPEQHMFKRAGKKMPAAFIRQPASRQMFA